MLPDDVKSWIEVSMRPARKRTKRMKLPTMTMPGRRHRLAARMRMRRMKKTPRLPVVTMYGIILCVR